MLHLFHPKDAKLRRRELRALQRTEFERPVIERAIAGMSYLAISLELGLRTGFVYSICHRAGIKAPRPPVPQDAAMVQRDQQIIEQVRARIPMSTVGRVFGISAERVRQICRRAGVRSQHKGGRKLRHTR